MAQGIKNRVFGSDVPVRIKKKIEARQNLARKDRSPNEQIKPSKYPDTRGPYYNYGELLNLDTSGIAHLSSTTPSVRMWTALNISQNVFNKDLQGQEEIDAWYADKEAGNHEGRDLYLRQISKDKWSEYEWLKLKDSRKIYVVGNHVLNTEDKNPNQQITGQVGTQGKNLISGDVAKVAYPWEQETDSNAFLSPPAGITSVTSETEGALGAMKRTTVTFQVHNFSDFEKIFLPYFLKPGAQLFVDIGWSTGLFYDPTDLIKNDKWNIEDGLYGDKGFVTLSGGDLDTMIGQVVNYSANLREDGGFDCEVEIVSKNWALLSTTLDSDFRDNIKNGLDIEILGMAAAGILGDPMLYYYARQWNRNEGVEDGLRTALADNVSKLIGGGGVSAPGQDSYKSALSLKWSVFSRWNASDSANDYYVSLGWIEDNFFNSELGFSDSHSSLKNSSATDAAEDEGKLFSKFNSKNSFAVWSEELATAMKDGGGGMEETFLYPETWGSQGTTYNILRGMHPDRYNADTKELVKFGSAYDDRYAVYEAEDKQKNRIPLREIFVNIDVIKNAVNGAADPGAIIKDILSSINGASKGMLDLAITSNNYAQNTIAMIDRQVVDKDVHQKMWDEMLTFHPYSPDTIVKNYNLSWKMPEGGVGNMYAIQSTTNPDESRGMEGISDTNLKKMLTGFIQHEKLERQKFGSQYKEPNSGLHDKFVRYEPSIGKEAGERFIRQATGQDSGGFNFDSSYIMFGKTTHDQIRKGEKPNFYWDTGNSDKILRNYIGSFSLRADNNEPIGDVNTYHRKLSAALYQPTSAVAEAAWIHESEDDLDPTNQDDADDAKSLAKSNGYALVSTPEDYFLSKARKSVDKSITTPLPIEAEITIHGMSGFVPGDLFKINYMPTIYRENVYFQIHAVEHEVSETWSTTLKAFMKVKPGALGTEDVDIENQRVTKDYLNKLELEDIDKFLPYFSNLKPVKLLPTKARQHGEEKPFSIIKEPRFIEPYAFEVEIAKEPNTQNNYPPTTLPTFYCDDHKREAEREQIIEPVEYLRKIIEDLTGDTIAEGSSESRTGQTGDVDAISGAGSQSPWPKVNFKWEWDDWFDATLFNWSHCEVTVNEWKQGMKFYLLINKERANPAAPTAGRLWTIAPFSDIQSEWHAYDDLFQTSTPIDENIQNNFYYNKPDENLQKLKAAFPDGLQTQADKDADGTLSEEEFNNILNSWNEFNNNDQISSADKMQVLNEDLITKIQQIQSLGCYDKKTWPDGTTGWQEDYSTEDANGNVIYPRRKPARCAELTSLEDVESGMLKGYLYDGEDWIGLTQGDEDLTPEVVEDAAWIPATYQPECEVCTTQHCSEESQKQGSAWVYGCEENGCDKNYCMFVNKIDGDFCVEARFPGDSPNGGLCYKCTDPNYPELQIIHGNVEFFQDLVREAKCWPAGTNPENYCPMQTAAYGFCANDTWHVGF